ncbi:unnamed protein product, partial [marine sediment metagenome]
VRDTAFVHTTAGKRQYGSTLDDRNALSGFTTIDSSQDLPTSAVNDVHAAVIEGKTYVAVGTDAGVSVINETDETVVDLVYDATFDEIDTLHLLSDGSLYYGFSNGSDSWRIWAKYNVQSITTDLSSNDVYDWLLNQNQPYATKSFATDIHDIFATQGTSIIDGTSNTIYIASDEGLSVIQEKQGDEDNGSVKYYTKDYITEEMVGDIRGMWHFTETSATTTVDDASIKGHDLTATTTVDNLTVSGVRGTGFEFNGTSEY